MKAVLIFNQIKSENHKWERDISVDFAQKIYMIIEMQTSDLAICIANPHLLQK